MSAFQENFFEHDSELEDYEDSESLGNDSELDLELDELDVMPQEFEAEGEIGQRSRLPFHPRLARCGLVRKVLLAVSRHIVRSLGGSFEGIRVRFSPMNP